MFLDLDYRLFKTIVLFSTAWLGLCSSMNYRRSSQERCPRNFELWGETCFAAITNIKVGWDDAQEICDLMAEGAKLVEITTLSQVLDLNFFLAEFTCSDWNSKGPWIGGIEVGDTNTFVWNSTGNPVQFLNWADLEPNSPAERDGIVLYCDEEYHAADETNESLMPFLCQAQPLPIATCPPSFHELEGQCYYLSTLEDGALDWVNAQNQCAFKAPTGKLADLETLEELHLVTEYLRTEDDSCSNRWIGAIEEGATQNFRWASTLEPIQFTNWYTGQPNENTSGDTVYISCAFDYTWFDLPPYTNLGYICEADKSSFN